MTAERAIAGLLLLTNLGLVGFVVGEGASGRFTAYTPAAFVTLKERVNQERLRQARASQPTDPATPTPPAPRGEPKPEHLIAGIEGFSGDPCPALEDLLDHMEAGITEAGGEIPPVDRKRLLSGTTCAIDDAAVNLALRKYRGAWVAAGLRPLYPFRFLGKSR